MKPLTIDLVSDVNCPWCAIGLNALLQALDELRPELQVTLRFQPFELNPDMPPEGEDRLDHLMRKYGRSADELAANWRAIQERGAQLGFEFGPQQGRRIHNSFDAHRLIHWAGLQSEAAQLAMKQALLAANFTQGENIDDPAALLRAVQAAGLDVEAARAVLDSQQFADEVRRQEGFFQRAGIQSVPAFVINHRHLISGGQPPEVFVQALRQLAQAPDAA
ncbi:disulfide bond formation protein DsbA [Comamonas serinivorans]|uniref:Disulfide bond formation protein DsbA n=1 Tax=Comamonas serinivorans TaxID=1082851 RepID=A0A1Y0EQN9_9BURK|nr:DsbA family oxidoreductase [Comamonas serinivorans]ARU05974.1 disulfide bond formation protein DsbA [Comamonas serinivorans]